jgi:hypothetical protein
LPDESLQQTRSKQKQKRNKARALTPFLGFIAVEQPADISAVKEQIQVFENILPEEQRKTLTQSQEEYIAGIHRKYTCECWIDNENPYRGIDQK